MPPYYREIHVDSSEDARSSGTKNHPILHLQDPLYIDYFCVRHITIPTTFDNLYEPSTLRWNVAHTGGTAFSQFDQVFQPGNYSTSDIALAIQDFWGDEEPAGITLSAVAGGDNTITMTFTGSVNLDYVTWAFLTSIDTLGGCVILQKLLGYGTNPTTVTLFDLNPAVQPVKTNPTKFSYPNFLMLRSNLCRGASFISNIRGPYVPNNSNLGNFTSGNILAKIPLNPGIVPPNSVFTYTNNDSPSISNMFTFDGEYVDSFDLYFTYPNDDFPVDFKGYNFSVTLGIISSRIP